VVSRAKQRIITFGLLAVAAGFLALGIAYQGDRSADEVRASTPLPASTATDQTGTDGATTSLAPATSPIEGFLPASGEASACREPVGVDLIDGYAATLTINGVAIAPEEMNVNLEGGETSDVITASRSLGHFTYGPEEDCPNGEVLRATNNVMQVCVYRLEDGPGSCSITERVFDAL
jgi:hypothetical protein